MIMKSRIQIAGVPHGSKEKTVWKGDLPAVSGFPGMRLVLYTPPGENSGDGVADSSVPLTFKQVCLEINTRTGEIEQVVYVLPTDKSKPVEIVE